MTPNGGVFMTGTDTGVGKTYVDAALVRGAEDALHAPGVHLDLLVGRVVWVA